MAIENAISEAAAEILKEGEALKSEEKQEEKSEEKSESSGEEEQIVEGEEKQEEEEKEEAVDPTKQKEAIALYNMLENPQTRVAVITALAKEMGVLKDLPETRTEVKETRKEIIDIFKEALGPEYAFLSDKIGKGIEAVLNQERQEQAEKFQQIELEKIQNQTDSVLNKLAGELKVSRNSAEFRNLEQRMADLVDDLPKGPNVSPEKYIRHLYTIASAGRTTVNKANLADKIRRNSGNTPERLTSGQSSVNKHVQIPDKKMSLKEATAFAYEQVFGEKK